MKLIGPVLLASSAFAATTLTPVSVISDGQPQAPATCVATALPQQTGWSGWGANNYNNRMAPPGSSIDSKSALSLTQKCKIQYKGGVSATPVVVDNIVYYPTWSGLFVALNYVSCQTVWEFNVTGFIENFGVTLLQANYTHTISRTSAAVDGNVLYFGTQTHALLVALDRTSGSLISHLQINTYPYAVLTMSPTVYEGTIFIGASSQEENAASNIPGYKCCSFIGNMVAVRLEGQLNVLWNVSMLPEAGWAGGAIWGSQPSVDVARSQIFVATGNVYTTPADFEACRNQAQNISVVKQGLVPDPCTPTDVYEESVLAFDMKTGFINWVRHLGALDSWIIACGTSGSAQNPKQGRNPSLCPQTPGVDADFGMAPTFIPGSPSTPHGQDTLVLGQKNGNLYALSAQAGTVFWATATGPDGNIGGIIWGVAVDEKQVYFTAVNSNLYTWKVQPTNETISYSAFGSVSLSDGSILWETPSPGGSLSSALPTVVNDVVFFSRIGNGTMLRADYDKTPGGLIPVDKATGVILKDYELMTNMHGGVAVVDNYVMFGTGYGGNSTGQFLVWSV